MKPARFIYLLLLLGLLDSCTPENDYPIVPELTFKDYYFTKDSSTFGIVDQFILVFEYIDGDGNIGMEDEEDYLGNDTNITAVVYVDYFEKRNGEFTRIPRSIGSEDSLEYRYRIPILTPEGENKSIRGEIQIKVDAYMLPRDTLKEIKYSLFLYDRDLNKSNVIESPVIPYQTPQ